MVKLKSKSKSLAGIWFDSRKASSLPCKLCCRRRSARCSLANILNVCTLAHTELDVLQLARAHGSKLDYIGCKTTTTTDDRWTTTRDWLKSSVSERNLVSRAEPLIKLSVCADARAAKATRAIIRSSPAAAKLSASRSSANVA